VKQLIEKGPKPKQTYLADGVIDYAKLLRAAKDNGMKYYLVEQEQYLGDSITSVKNDAAFMKGLKIQKNIFPNSTTVYFEFPDRTKSY
jgi:sugar phosphate isomerase/epimerase